MPRTETTAVPSARDARRLIRSYRLRHTSARERVADLLLVAMYAAMIVGLVAGATQAGFDRAAAMDAVVTSTVLRHWVVALGVSLVAISCAKVALTFGPVLVRGPTQSWLLSSPIDRRMLLVGRFAIVAACGAVTGALLALLAMIAGGGAADAVSVALVIGGALGSTVASATVLIQASAVRVRRAQAGLNVMLGACVAALVTVLAFRPSASPAVADLVTNQGMIAMATALVAAGVTTWFAQAFLARLGRAQLSVGADIAEATAVTATFMEPTILWGVLLIKRARRIGRVHSVRFRGTRPATLVMADLVRVRRTWAGPAVWAGLLPVPYLAEAIVAPVALPAIHLITAFLAADRLAGGLRIICRTPALRRMLGGSDRQLILAHLALPTAGVIVWCAATAPALPSMTFLVCALSAAGSVLVIYRMATRPPIEYTTPMLETGFGTGGVPIWLSLQLSRGPALLFVFVWVQTAFVS